jgi:hypothetical protein
MMAYRLKRHELLLVDPRGSQSSCRERHRRHPQAGLYGQRFGGNHIRTLLVFFALMGGVKAFGVMGLFIGPVVLSVTLVLLQMLQESNVDHPMTDGASPGPSVRG